MSNTKTQQKSKSFSFQSSTRAQHVYEQALQIVSTFFSNAAGLVKITGNVVTVPDWFPFSAN